MTHEERLVPSDPTHGWSVLTAALPMFYWRILDSLAIAKSALPHRPHLDFDSPHTPDVWVTRQSIMAMKWCDISKFVG